MLKPRLKFILPIMFLSACGTKQTIKVTSNPTGANVYLKMLGKSERKNIGKTPLVQESISTLLNGPVSGAIYLEIEKEEYMPATILVTETAGTMLEVSQELKPMPKDTNKLANTQVENNKPANEADQKKDKTTEVKKTDTQNEAVANNVNPVELNKGLENLFEAQRLARVGRLDDALKLLDEVGKSHPSLSSVHEMKGGIYYLQKDYKKALDEYKKTVSLNVDSVTAHQMIKKLEAKVKTDL